MFFVLQETDRGQSVAKSKEVHLTKLNVAADEKQFVAIRRLVELGLKGKSK
jgi:hypothetical protein